MGTNEELNVCRLVINGLDHDLILDFRLAEPSPPVVRLLQSLAAANVQAGRVSAPHSASTSSATARDLVNSHIVQGDEARAGQNPSAAREHYKRAAEVAAQADPGDQQVRYPLFLASIRLAEIALDQGDGDTAGRHCGRSMELGLELVQANPGATQVAWQVSNLALNMTNLVSRV